MDNVPNENYGGNSETLHNSDDVNNELKNGEKYQPKIANDKNKTRHEIYTNSINHQIELNEIDEFDFDLDNINSPVNDNNLKPVKRFFNFTFDENSFLPPSFNTPYLIKNHIVQYMDPIFKKAKKKGYLCCWT